MAATNPTILYLNQLAEQGEIVLYAGARSLIIKLLNKVVKLELNNLFHEIDFYNWSNEHFSGDVLSMIHQQLQNIENTCPVMIELMKQGMILSLLNSLPPEKKHFNAWDIKRTIACSDELNGIWNLRSPKHDSWLEQDDFNSKYKLDVRVMSGGFVETLLMSEETVWGLMVANNHTIQGSLIMSVCDETIGKKDLEYFKAEVADDKVYEMVVDGSVYCFSSAEFIRGVHTGAKWLKNVSLVKNYELSEWDEKGEKVKVEYKVEGGSKVIDVGKNNGGVGIGVAGVGVGVR